MAITIQTVESARDLATFITLPRRLYEGMKGYVAPLDFERRQLLDPQRAGFFADGEAAYFLAIRDGAPVGRISAQIGPPSRANGPGSASNGPDPVGLFGCFDGIDDPAASAALLASAEGWLRSRGRSVARGPFLLSINGESGLLIDGFDQPPMLLMPWHPPYLRSHLERAGYALAKRLDSSVLDLDSPDLKQKLALLGLERRRTAFTVRPMSMKNLASDIEQGRQLFNQSWADNWGFVPVSVEEMGKLVDGFRQLLRPEYGVFVERGGKLVGFALFLPNIFDISADLGGSPNLIGWLKLAFRGAMSQFTSGRTVLFGVARDLLQTAAGSSVALILVDELIKRAEKTRFRRVECGWVLEDNRAMQAMIEWTGAKRIRQFGVFEKSLSPATWSVRPEQDEQGWS